MHAEPRTDQVADRAARRRNTRNTLALAGLIAAGIGDSKAWRRIAEALQKEAGAGLTAT